MSTAVREDSRYLSTDVLIDTQGNKYFDLWTPINFPQRSDDKVHKIASYDQGRLERIANNFYGNPRLWWIIATANNIEDPFELLPIGYVIRIPDQMFVRQVMQDVANR